MGDRAAHWNDVYSTKAETEVSWFEQTPEVSLRLLDAAGVRPDACILDVGGGDSHLVDALLPRGLLAAELGPAFELIESHHHLHTTPWGRTQAFQYSRFRRR